MQQSTLTRPDTSRGFSGVPNERTFRCIRVAIYARVSTEEQLSGFGLENQDDVNNRWIDARTHLGYKRVDTYEDRGVSGTIIERPELMRLGRDARAGKIDVVLVYAFDRIGRVGRAFWRWIWELEDYNVAVASATQDIDTSTPVGLLALQQYASFAEMEHGMIIARMQGGLNAKARQGGWVGGTPPYGYRIQDKGTRKSALVIDREEAETVMRVYDWLVSERLGTPEIARRLNIEGRLTRSGREWDSNNLRKIFKENSFAGSYTFRKPKNAKQTKQPLGTHARQAKYGPPIVVSIPAILDEDESALLAAALQRTAGKCGVKKVYSYPLSGRIFGECGRAYVGHAHTSNGVRYYVCSGNSRSRTCGDRALLSDVIEEVVWADIVRTLDAPERVKAMAADWVAEMPGNTDKLAARARELRAQLEAQETAIITTVVTYAKQNLPAQVVGQAVAQLSNERDALAELLGEAENSLAELRNREALAKDLEGLVNTAQENLRDMTSKDQRRMIELLDIRVDIRGSASSGRGRPCTLTNWFVEQDRQVPNTLTDAQWSAVVGTFPLSQRKNADVEARTRAMVEAAFHKLRTGCAWADLPDGSPEPVATNTRVARWLRSGLWAVLIDALGDCEGSEPAKHRPLPPMSVTGALDLRMNTRRSTSASMLGEPCVTIPLNFSLA